MNTTGKTTVFYLKIIAVLIIKNVWYFVLIIHSYTKKLHQ